MATKNSRCQKVEEHTLGGSTRRSGKKYRQMNDTGNSLRRSPRLNEKAKPSQAIIAAKRNARMCQSNKKIPDVIIRDIYYVAQEAKNMIRRDTGIVYDYTMSEHRCLWDSTYPECPARLTEVLKRCEALGLLLRCVLVEPRLATEKEVLMCHSQEQLDILKATSHCKDEEFLEELSSRYDAIYIHPSTYHLSLLSAGSTIQIVDAVCTGKVQNGMAIVRPPGHHAMKSEYCGYCFFNNVALAAKHAVVNCGISRVLIVDWDVHHGQATQQMFYNDPSVVYFSIHRYEHGSFWPNLRESDFHYVGEGCGLGYNFNVPLNKVGMTDADYLAIFHQVLLPMASEFQPELILVSAGYDAAIGCPEGEMEVTPVCYAHLLNMLMCLAGGKVAVILEGGYCLQSLAEGAALTLRTLLGDPCPLLPSLGPPCESICDSILNVIYAHQEYWKCYQFQDTYSIHSEPTKTSVKGNRHLPAVKFLGSDEKPTRFATRNCYPVQNQKFIADVTSRLNTLIANTKLTYAPHRVCLVYDEQMMKHKNIGDPGHPEKPERISAIFSRHEEYGLLKRCLILQSRSVTEEELLLLHTKEYINLLQGTANMKLRELVKKQEEYQSIYFNPASYQTACLAVGSVLQVVDSVLNGESRSGVAIVRPPGHHAEEDEPCGFCLFNNTALAAKYAIEVHGLKRILLLDWDVHHGNGSQHMFESDARVLYISIHRYDNGSFFPCSTDANYNVVGTGKGEGFNVNIPWNKSGMKDADYIATFYQIILPICYQFNPELVLVSSGFDACIGDPLGGCKVNPEAYGHMTQMLTGLAGGRVILSLEGGYNLNSISHAMPLCTKALLGDPLPPLASHQVVCPSAVTSLKNVIRTHAQYWSALNFQAALPQEKVLPKPQDRPLEGIFEDNTCPKENIYIEEGTELAKDTDILHSTPKQIISTKIEEISFQSTKEETDPCNTLQYYFSKIDLNEKSVKDIERTTKSEISPLSLHENKNCLKLSNDANTCLNKGTPVCSKSDSNIEKTLQVYDISNDKTNLIKACTGEQSVELKTEKQSIFQGNESGKECYTTYGDDKNTSSKERDVPQSGDAGEGACGSSNPTAGNTISLQALLSNLPEQIQMEGEMYVIMPRSDCPHLVQVQPVPDCGIDCTNPCVDCGSPQENWVCLICYTVHCGRYVNEHMMLHGSETLHPLTLSFSDLSVWCYACEAYIDNKILYAAKNAVHQSKFGEDMPWSYGDTDSSHPT